MLLSPHLTTVLRTLRVSGVSLVLLAGRASSMSPFPQNFVDLQSSTPGTQQSGHSNISGTGIFGTSLGVGTSSPLTGLHVKQEADPLAGTLALEGNTTTYLTFFPKGAANGRKGYLGYTSPTSDTLWLHNEQTFGNISLQAGPSAGVGINIAGVSNRGLNVYTNATNGYAVFGDSGYTGSSTTYGVFGRANSSFAIGVFGLALPSSGTTTGVYGRTDSTTGRGVYGGTTKTSGTCFGVYGYTGSSQGYALYGQGRFAATGTKSFVIDHPFDPEGMTLSHYCAEGPEPLNEYSGNAFLDDAGEAWVALPDYFEEINTDPRYILTALGAPMPGLHVAAEIRQNRFKIGGGVARGKVSWRIDAVRNDRWVRVHGAPVEQAKPAEIAGKYLEPELYGQPAERGINYVPEDLERK